MASLFNQIIACCCRSRSRGPGEGANEHTHLIPPTEEVPAVRTYVVDQQKMHERLGTIVHAKEGKMVNVNAQLPFNLHNRPLDPSTTRSRSVSAHTPYTAQPNASVSQFRSPSYSPPPRPASSSIPTSHSTSSLHPGDASYIPPEVNPENGARRPAFNVRFVHAPGVGVWVRRGRSVTRGRYSRFGDQRSEGRQAISGVDSIWEGTALDSTNGDVTAEGAEQSRDEDKQTDGHGDGAEDPEGGTGPLSSDGQVESTAHSPIEAHPTAADEPEAAAGGDGAATGNAPEFRIQIEDVGKISQSWGD